MQDYRQYKAGSETCDRRTVYTDNTAPGKPASLAVTSANPARYLDRFGATFSLLPDQGSPIVMVHYEGHRRRRQGGRTGEGPGRE